jgi:hypothetical protein
VAGTSVALGVLAGGSAPASTATPSADLSAMTLQRADLPSGSTLVRSEFTDGTRQSYLQVWRVGRLTSARRDGAEVITSAAVAPSGEVARSDVASTRRQLTTAEGRRAFAREIAPLGNTSGIRAKDVHLGRAHALAIGAAAMMIPASVNTSIGRLHVTFAAVAVGRGEGLLFVVAQPRSRLANTTTRLLRHAAGRIGSRLPPDDVGLPTVTGSPGPGQVLTAGPGTWTPVDPPASFTYQWLRCDSAGLSCQEIAGATGETYTLTAADDGAAIRVAVVAATPNGTGTAISDPTQAVQP